MQITWIRCVTLCDGIYNNVAFTMDGWVRGLRPFQQYFSHIGTMEGEHEKLCATKRRLCSGRISPPARSEPATPWSEVGSSNRTLLCVYQITQREEPMDTVASTRLLMAESSRLGMKSANKMCFWCHMINRIQYNYWIYQTLGKTRYWYAGQSLVSYLFPQLV